MREWHFRSYLTIFLWCSAAVVLTHCPMLFKPHTEGDELVYFALSQRMGWDLSNYTTRDDSRIRQFPYSIYQAPLFHHPPLYPLVLKAGMGFTSNPILQLPGVATPRATQAIVNAIRGKQPDSDIKVGDALGGINGQFVAVVPGEAVAAAFLFAVFVTVAALFYTWRLMVLFKMEPSYGVAAMVGLVICPLLLFSTVRLHHDGLAGLMLLCGIGAFVEALERKCLRVAIEAAVWLTVAMNTRYSMIVALPLLAAIPMYWMQVRGRQAGFATDAARQDVTPGQSAGQSRNWLILAIVFGCVLTFGMQHYYRVLWTYGTIWPYAFIKPIVDIANFSPFMALLEKMTRTWVFWELAAMFPLGILFVVPWNLKATWRGLREGQAPAAFVLMFLFLFAVQIAAVYKPVRYFAAITPFMHLCWPFLLRNTPAREWIRWNIVGLAGVTVLLMITTGFLTSVVKPTGSAAVVPSLTSYWPPLMKDYTVGR